MTADKLTVSEINQSKISCLGAVQIATLESEMRSLEEDLEGLAGLLQQGIFTDPESPPAEAVSELDDIQDRLAALKVRLLQYARPHYTACQT